MIFDRTIILFSFTLSKVTYHFSNYLILPGSFGRYQTVEDLWDVFTSSEHEEDHYGDQQNVADEFCRVLMDVIGRTRWRPDHVNLLWKRINRSRYFLDSSLICFCLDQLIFFMLNYRGHFTSIIWKRFKLCAIFETIINLITTINCFILKIAQSVALS